MTPGIATKAEVGGARMSTKRLTRRVQWLIVILSIMPFAIAQEAGQPNDGQAARAKSLSAGNKPTSQNKSQVQNDILDKYSIDQLQQVLTARGNKSLYQPEPAELNDISTSAMADKVISRQKTLYGLGDTRKEMFEIQDPEVLKVADSVAGIIPTDRLQFGNDSVMISGQSLGQRFSLCRQESYYDEPAAADCTAFVVGADLIATAGHCVSGAGSARIIFGFRELKDSSGVHALMVIPNSQVYRVAQVVTRRPIPAVLISRF